MRRNASRQLAIPLLCAALGFGFIAAAGRAEATSAVPVSSDANKTATAKVLELVRLPEALRQFVLHEIPARYAVAAPRTIVMEVTAYCPCKKCCGPKAKGITASGRHVSHNAGQFVAADTRVLPFNTKIIVPGYASNRPIEVLDRGGAIKGNKLDVFFDTHQAALEWGRQKVEVIVLD